MPEVARGDQVDTVDSLTGSGGNCAFPLVTATNVCSPNVFANETGIVREDDLIQPHPKPGCVTDTSVVTTFSASVWVNGKRAARKGDQYTSDNIITSGSPTVFFGGPITIISAPKLQLTITQIQEIEDFLDTESVQIDQALQDYNTAGGGTAGNTAISGSSVYNDPSITNNQVPLLGRTGIPVDTGTSISPNELGNTPIIPAPSNATADNIVSLLSQLLQEANTGNWDETQPTTGQSNPNIVGIWRELGFPSDSYWTTDQTPWCAGFLNWVLKRTGHRWVQSARANSIINRTPDYNGTPVPIAQGQPGDMCYWSYSHVNFIYRVISPGVYTFVGGNQSDNGRNDNNPSNGSVTESWSSGYNANTGGNGSLRNIIRPSKD